MIILEHSTYDADSIAQNLGSAEYSYWFVRKAFRPLLERFGLVIPVLHPDREVDRIHRAAKAQGIASVFISFNPPHRTLVGLECPTVPVFAWEYDRIPDETWEKDPRNNWADVLSQVPAAITHSRSSVEAVRRSLGADYPIWSIPAPVKNRGVSEAAMAGGLREATEVDLGPCVAVDAGAIDLSLFRGARANSHGVRALGLLELAALGQGQGRTLNLDGVVYSSVFNPVDERKNWPDMLAGFVVAFRNTPDATLVLKTTHRDIVESALPILSELSLFGPFKCRVIVIHGLLPDTGYGQLIDATSFTVNASQGEGQCLPLMEFMAAGRPAVTPRHTGMLEYVSDDNAFVVASHLRPGFWPHDVRQAIRCMRHEISFADLVRRYRESYAVASFDPARYRRMALAAVRALDGFCADSVMTERMGQVMRYLMPQRKPIPTPEAQQDGPSAVIERAAE